MKKYKYIKPIIVKDAWHKPLAKEVYGAFKESMFDPLLEIIDEEDAHENAKKSPLEKALKDGTIQYNGSFFNGKLNAAISKEIKELGGRFVKGKWHLIPQQMPDYLQKAANANKKEMAGLWDKISAKLEEMAEKATSAIKGMDVRSMGAYGMDRTTKEFKKTVGAAMSVQPKLKDEGKKIVKTDYVETMTKPIRSSLLGQMDSTTKDASLNFSYGEIVKLREELSAMVAAGEPRDKVKDYIQSRLKVSKNKAAFIARQETSLYTSKLKEAQYKQAEISKYKWKTVGDSRVRHDHRLLNNKVFSWDNPPSADYFSCKQPCHPGEDYNCRCVAQPIVEW